MQVRVRVEIPDSPGALAGLANLCSESYVNILSVRVYPAVETVIDDLILEVPDYWSMTDIKGLFESGGGTNVAVLESSRGDLEDETTRWLSAALAVLEQPSRFDVVVKQLMGPVSAPVHTESQRIEALKQFQLVAKELALGSRSSANSGRMPVGVTRTVTAAVGIGSAFAATASRGVVRVLRI